MKLIRLFPEKLEVLVGLSEVPVSASCSVAAAAVWAEQTNSGTATRSTGSETNRSSSSDKLEFETLPAAEI